MTLPPSLCTIKQALNNSSMNYQPLKMATHPGVAETLNESEFPQVYKSPLSANDTTSSPMIM